MWLQIALFSAGFETPKTKTKAKMKIKTKIKNKGKEEELVCSFHETSSSTSRRTRKIVRRGERSYRAARQEGEGRYEHEEVTLRPETCRSDSVLFLYWEPPAAATPFSSSVVDLFVLMELLLANISSSRSTKDRQLLLTSSQANCSTWDPQWGALYLHKLTHLDLQLHQDFYSVWVFLMGSICVDRYLAIVHAASTLHPWKTTVAAKCVSAGVWFIAVVVTYSFQTSALNSNSSCVSLPTHFYLTVLEFLLPMLAVVGFTVRVGPGDSSERGHAHPEQHRDLRSQPGAVGVERRSFPRQNPGRKENPSRLKEGDQEDVIITVVTRF